MARVANSAEALKRIEKVARCCVTDKVYANKEWNYGYRENDRLGGYDPYSAKAAAEMAVNSWRASFCGDGKGQNPYLAIAETSRKCNRGGDWAADRIVPDA